MSPGTSNIYDYSEACSRNIGLTSPAEQQRLRATRVAIAGLGGVGGGYALALARLGVGGFALSDLDRFEIGNMNRQAGASMPVVGKPKADVVSEMVQAINPTAAISVFPRGINDENVDKFLDDVDVFIDGVDFFAMSTRRLLFRKARERRIYGLTSAPVGFGATLHVFGPDGMTFDEYFDLDDGMTLEEQLVHLGLGLTPRLLQLRYFSPSKLDLSGRRAPSMGSACLLCAALVATEVANLVLRRRPVRTVPQFYQFDPLVQRYAAGRLKWGNRHPLQRLKKWWVLKRNPSLRQAIRDAQRRPSPQT